MLSFRSGRRRMTAGAAVVLFALAAAPALAQSQAQSRRKKPERMTRPKDPARTLAVFHTSQGEITIRFFFDRAPNHVRNFINLCASGFYNGTLFHRVVPLFVVQGGDPLTKDKAAANFWGTGGNRDARGNPITLKAEFNDITHRRGIVSMARAQSDPESGSSQFFIVLKDSPFLDRQFTVFGEVVKGMDVVDRIAAESNVDPQSGPRGVPRNYQALEKVDLVEDTAAKSAPR